MLVDLLGKDYVLICGIFFFELRRICAWNEHSLPVVNMVNKFTVQLAPF